MKDIKLIDATPDYSGKVKVSITSDYTDVQYTTMMSMEEYKLRAMIIAIDQALSPLVAKELADLIDDYGTERYSEGYDAGSYESHN